jgi:hypothetical protein
VSAALAEGILTAPGDAPPFVHATHIHTEHQHGSQP